MRVVSRVKVEQTFDNATRIKSPTARFLTAQRRATGTFSRDDSQTSTQGSRLQLLLVSHKQQLVPQSHENTSVRTSPSHLSNVEGQLATSLSGALEGECTSLELHPACESLYYGHDEEMGAKGEQRQRAGVAIKTTRRAVSGRVKSRCGSTSSGTCRMANFAERQQNGINHPSSTA